jgi:putative phosphoribosyl transferase
MLFQNRIEAGHLLSEKLLEYTNRKNVLVLGLPRGGIPVACKIASRLHLRLDVLIVRKLGVPGNKELAFGAIASGGIRILNQDIIDQFQLDSEIIAEVTQSEMSELKRREKLYQSGHHLFNIKNKTIILVDDGIATGATIRAALSALRKKQPAKIIIAVPVLSSSSFRELKNEADDIISLLIPDIFYGVGEWYQDFSQTTDQELQQLLKQFTF